MTPDIDGPERGPIAWPRNGKEPAQLHNSSDDFSDGGQINGVNFHGATLRRRCALT